MARPKKKRTKKNAAPVITPVAAPVADKAVTEVKSEPVPAVSEPAAPVVEAFSDVKVSAETKVADVKETKAAPKKKAAPAKAEAKKKDDVFVFQSSGKDYTLSDITELCKAAYRNGTRKQVKSCDVYVKAENGGLRAYYVINDKSEGAFIDL